MRTLAFLRHAKSSWATAGLADHDRPLNARGRRDAPRMASVVATSLTPGLVLCSTARRTRETWELIAPAFAASPPRVAFEDGIYEAPPSRLLARLRALPDTTDRVLVIGHNPGIQGAVLDLVGSGDRDLIKQIAIKYPTCALALLTFDTERWSGVRPAAGRLDRFIRPRDLTDDETGDL